LHIIGGIGVGVRVEFCEWRHGARDERRRRGKVWCWDTLKNWFLGRLAGGRNVSERIEKDLKLKLKFAEGWVIHEQSSCIVKQRLNGGRNQDRLALK
jgi:hypothetical protein